MIRRITHAARLQRLGRPASRLSSARQKIWSAAGTWPAYCSAGRVTAKGQHVEYCEGDDEHARLLALRPDHGAPLSSADNG
jgi:hypothetical protein